MNSTHAPVRTFKVRRRVTTGQAEALTRLLPLHGVDRSQPFDPVRVFGRHAPLVLEIGSGMGEATAAMAATDPAATCSRSRCTRPGSATCCGSSRTAGLTNVRVLEADAREVLAELLGPGSLDEVRVYFPDPWPKVRHVKRRLVTQAFADLVATRLRPGGLLHVATDWASYAAQAEQVLAHHPAYEVVSRGRGARPVTRFEQRGLDAGRRPYDLRVRRH
jgi:tRNA (guanine-N7-)-methyltransferase